MWVAQGKRTHGPAFQGWHLWQEYCSSHGFPVLTSKGAGGDVFHLLTEKSSVWAPPSHTLRATRTVPGARMSAVLPTTASQVHICLPSPSSQDTWKRSRGRNKTLPFKVCALVSDDLRTQYLKHCMCYTKTRGKEGFEWFCMTKKVYGPFPRIWVGLWHRDALATDRIEWKWSCVTSKARSEEVIKLLSFPQKTHFSQLWLLWGCHVAREPQMTFHPSQQWPLASQDSTRRFQIPINEPLCPAEAPEIVEHILHSPSAWFKFPTENAWA